MSEGQGTEPFQVQPIETAPLRPGNPPLVDELLSPTRLLVIAGVLVVEFAIFLAGLLTPLDQASAQVLANQTSSQFGFVQEGNTGTIILMIFAHNTGIALRDMVPVVGALFLGLSLYTTGLATQALVVSAGHPGTQGLILFLFPYFEVEFSGYAIAVGAGVMLLLSVRRKLVKRELRVFFAEVLVVAAVLIVAAIMETLTIVLPLVGLALWVPTALAVAGLALRARKVPR